MPITELLAKNAALYGDEVCLTEINPEVAESRAVTWKEYDLVQTDPAKHSRREMTWREFDDRANRFANLLLSRGVGVSDLLSILGSMDYVLADVDR